MSQIHERLDVMETAMLAYKRQFSAYEYLWTTDLQAMFREFLEGASYDEAMEEDDDDAAGMPRFYDPYFQTLMPTRPHLAFHLWCVRQETDGGDVAYRQGAAHEQIVVCACISRQWKAATKFQHVASFSVCGCVHVDAVGRR